jgi:hypothetical protein
MTSVFNREDAWNEIFNEYPILDSVDRDGFYDIQADDIKKYKEPRLMCKVDFRENTPAIMRDNGLSILAINNGVYRIARNSPFIDIQEELTRPIEEIPPPQLITLDYKNPSSESAALDIAYATGILDEIFQNESKLTIRGRRRCDLDFVLGPVSYPVRGVQVEVDGGYETASSILLIEAKLGSANNINIRQLLYPHRYWQNFAAARKDLFSYIFFYQAGIYRFIPFFAEGHDYIVDHSKERLFKLVDSSPRISLRSIKVEKGKVNGQVPFPQADKLDKVIAFVLKIASAEIISKEDIALMFDLVPRQIDYYSNAGIWLNLINYDALNQSFTLSEEGRTFSGLSYPNQIATIAKIVLSNTVFNFALHNPNLDVPIPIRNENGLSTESTYRRRMITVKSWLSHIENVLSGDLYR